MKTTIRVNDTMHELSVDSRVTLLDALRDELSDEEIRECTSG